MALIGIVWLMAAGPVWAEDGFSALARVQPRDSQIGDAARGRARIELALSQAVPFRIFTLDAPPRLVIDFREVDWDGVDLGKLFDPGRITDVAAGTYVPGWSRLVARLTRPMGGESAAMAVDDDAGTARLSVMLEPVETDVFAQSAGAPADAGWDLPPVAAANPSRRDPAAPLAVVLDPGHGGIDPGAQRGEVQEKDLMLTFARELREELLRAGGYEVTLTRTDDSFVSLERRISLARAAGADVFLSLHADALSEGLAHGATVHVLSDAASDIASAKLAERHDRADILSGVDLTEADDQVTGILLDLARQETQPRTEALADALVRGMGQSGGPMNRRPMRSAAFSVLKSADIPSVLIEIGFLSSPRDFNNLTDPAWRLRMARGIRNGLDTWRREDTVLRDRVRQ